MMDSAVARVLTLVGFLAGCGGTDTPTDPESPVPTTVALAPSTLAFSGPGETEQLSATVRDQNGAVMNGAAVTWSSSSPAVASVTSAGLVTAEGPGVADIEATSGDAVGAAAVTVADAPATMLEPSDLCSEHPPSSIAAFEDAALESAVRAALGLGSGDDLTCDLVGGLASLTANSLGIESLAGIQNLTDLTVLRLNFNDAITDITPLEGLTNLFDLGLNRNAITDVSPLANLTGLTSLDLANNDIVDVSPIVDLPLLSGLNLGFNSITDITPLADLASLTILTLKGNDPADFTPLEELTDLASLDISFTGMTDIAPVAGLTELRHLWLNNNSISDVTELAGLTQLTRILLSNNSITDLTPLGALSELETVDVRHNAALSDIQPLLDNSGIGPGDDVWLEGTQVACADFTALEAKGVAVYGECTTPVTPIELDRVTAGYRHACGLTPSGEAYCWGDNFVGQLGDGTETRRTLATPVLGGMTFTDIDAGRIHTCALATGGSAYCWGSNANGQLGDSTQALQWSEPVAVAGGHVFESIDAGDWHTCARTANDEGWCWGTNTTHQLGYTWNADCPVFGGEYCIDRYPRAISGSFEFTMLSAGRLHSCGVTTAEEAYCWGISGEGQLGDGATTLSGRLGVLVAGGLAWSEVVAAGNNSAGGHTCGVTTDGDAYCWGGSAELGDGTTLGYTPRLVTGGGQYLTITAKGGSVDNAHTCAITTGGAAYCWGANGDGQVGDGTDEHRPTPVAVAGGHVFTTISAGGVDEENGFTCATATDGYAYCWGRNGLGQLGDGTYYPKNVPVRVGTN